MEVDSFLIEKISEKLAKNKYPATFVGQRKLFADCRKDKALKDYTFKNVELVGNQYFGELCMRATYQHTLKEEFNSYYGLTLGYPYFKKPLKPNKKDTIIKELKKIIQNHEIPVYIPCLKSKETLQKQQYKNQLNRLTKKQDIKPSFENIFDIFFGILFILGILISFAPLVLSFYYAFFIYDPGTTTETSDCSFGNPIAIGKLICTEKTVPASIGWNFLVWFILTGLYVFILNIIGKLKPLFQGFIIFIILVLALIAIGV